LSYLKARLTERSTHLAIANLIKVSLLFSFPAYQEFILAAMLVVNTLAGVTQG
jgi:hypothetical protein